MWYLQRVAVVTGLPSTFAELGESKNVEVHQQPNILSIYMESFMQTVTYDISRALRRISVACVYRASRTVVHAFVSIEKVAYAVVSIEKYTQATVVIAHLVGR